MGTGTRPVSAHIGHAVDGRKMPYRTASAIASTPPYASLPDGCPYRAVSVETLNTRAVIENPMRSFSFKVVPQDGGDGKVPITVAGQTMVDVQNVLTEITSTLLRTEFRLQGELPSGILDRYMLTIGGSGSGDIGSNPGRDGRPMLEACLDTFCYTLDFMGKGVIGNWMVENFIETLGRRRIGEALVRLADNLKGYTLMYGEPGQEREFKALNREKLMAQIDADSARTQNSACIGKMLRDPAKKGKYLLTNGAFTIPAEFATNISVQGKEASVDSGLIICVGKSNNDHDGMVTSMKEVTGIHLLPEVRFNRVISATRDIEMAVPLPAAVSVSKDGRNWNIRNDDLGIDITKNSWDECVLAFHDYFVFLWENYAESDEEFEGEEQEIKELLISYTPFM